MKNINFRLLRLTKNLINSIHYSKKGPFNALPSTVFQVVKQTQKYHQFIPWCSRSSLIKQISPSQNYTELTIRFNNLKQLSYLSHVQIQEENSKNQFYKVESICKDNPLKSLISIWQIKKNPIVEGQIQKSFVKYSIDYEFSSPLLQLTSHLFLNYVGESMWLIFKQQSQKRQRIIKKNNNLSSQSNEELHILNSQKEKKYLVDSEIQIQMRQDKINLNHIKTSKKQNNQGIQQKSCRNLIEYLNKNQKIRQIYTKNLQFKDKIEIWSRNLEGTDNFQKKLEFKIKNYLLYKG